MFRRKRRTPEQPEPAPVDPDAAPDPDEDLDSAPGWDAITAAPERLYPGVEPRHVAPSRGLAFGDPLEGLSAYPALDHWHFVTIGMTDLYQDHSPDSEWSGWGYEITIRVAPLTEEPPQWAFRLLYELAGSLRDEGEPLGVGHRFDPGGPIDGDQTRLTALAFTLDPGLGSIETPHGRILFLQAVGITAEELAETKATSTAAVLDRMRAASPELVTDPTR